MYLLLFICLLRLLIESGFKARDLAGFFFAFYLVGPTLHY